MDTMRDRNGQPWDIFRGEGGVSGCEGGVSSCEGLVPTDPRRCGAGKPASCRPKARPVSQLDSLGFSESFCIFFSELPEH